MPKLYLFKKNSSIAIDFKTRWHVASNFVCFSQEFFGFSVFYGSIEEAVSTVKFQSKNIMV